VLQGSKRVVVSGITAGIVDELFLGGRVLNAAKKLLHPDEVGQPHRVLLPRLPLLDLRAWPGPSFGKNIRFPWTVLANRR
jgi:hypothetical protein